MISSPVEKIVDGLEPIALIIRTDFETSGLHFFTPDNFSQQVAYMSHPKGKSFHRIRTTLFRGRFYTHKKYLLLEREALR